MLVYNIGRSAIAANQTALQTISNNIANANTAGYHRQRVNLTESRPIILAGFHYGTGVNVESIVRMVDSATDGAITLNMGQSADAQARIDVLRAMEGLLTPAAGSLTSSVADYFDSVERMQTNPTEGTFRRTVTAAAENVARQITNLNQGLDQLQRQQQNLIYETVDQINSLSSQITAIDTQIRLARAGGTEPSTLLDQRDLLVQKLGQFVDINPGSFSKVGSPLVAAGGWMVVGASPPLSVNRTPDGSFEIQIGSQGPVVPVSGKLAGLLQAHNEIIPAARESLMEWTSAFVSGVNSIQSTGLNLNGPVSLALGTNTVADRTIPLSQAKPLFPISAGTLAITVTHSASGERKTYQVPINPANDSLEDVVNRIDGLANVSARFSSTGQVVITGDAGYTIDFAGRPDPLPDTSGMTGTAIPRLSGLYEGPQNANWTVTAISGGQIGSTTGLTLRVSDSVTGQLVGDFNVGDGYQADRPIEIADGLFLQLNAGTLTAGDSFQIQAISNSDSAGFLTAMGIGGLFETSDLRNITVNSAISRDPGLLSSSRNGDPGDTSQINRINLLRIAPIMTSGTETLEERLASITSNAGLEVNILDAYSSHLESQHKQLRNQQDAVSGVDPNEELLSMLQFQRGFQANARFIATVNNALDDLLQLVR